jgi:hypothetical protein
MWGQVLDMLEESGCIGRAMEVGCSDFMMCSEHDANQQPVAGVPEARHDLGSRLPTDCFISKLDHMYTNFASKDNGCQPIDKHFTYWSCMRDLE